MTPREIAEGGEHYARNSEVREEPNIKCPCCGWNQALNRKGTRARLRGDDVREIRGPALPGRLDPETETFISIRDASGGRGRGFPALRSYTFAQAATDPAFHTYATMVLAWARRLVQLADRLGL